VIVLLLLLPLPSLFDELEENPIENLLRSFLKGSNEGEIVVFVTGEVSLELLSLFGGFEVNSEHIIGEFVQIDCDFLLNGWEVTVWVSSRCRMKSR
jgi:hypothetical protein